MALCPWTPEEVRVECKHGKLMKRGDTLIKFCFKFCPTMKKIKADEYLTKKEEKVIIK